MSYPNKTYVAVASDDIHYYRLLEAWRDGQIIDFDFADAHDPNISRDASLPEAIRRNLRARMNNAKRIILLGSKIGRRKVGNGTSFLADEIRNAIELNLPIVFANLDGTCTAVEAVIPLPLFDQNYYTVSVSFQPKIITQALDHHVPVIRKDVTKLGPHQYNETIYRALGL